MRSIERSGKVRNGTGLGKFCNRRLFWERKESEFMSDKQTKFKQEMKFYAGADRPAGKQTL
jgi:hypothetical protein